MADVSPDLRSAMTEKNAHQPEPRQLETPPGSPAGAADNPAGQDAGPVREDGGTGTTAPDGGAKATTDNPVTGRPDIAARYPADYVPSSDPAPSVDRPHESPEKWADGINPGWPVPERENNCGECARAVDSTWNGKGAAAAAMSDPEAAGESVARMTEWAGEAQTRASMSEVQQQLNDMGPGSSAVVLSCWDGGGAHWFNAVNDGGTVKAIDGQSGTTETWPPSASGLGFDEGDMRYSGAIFFTADGKVVKK
jgi:hypothetical protein